MLRKGVQLSIVAALCLISFAQVIPHDASMELYKSATLQCDVEGVTSYKPMLWYHHGILIVPDNEKYETNDSNNTLTIHHCGEKDAGEYQCGFVLDNNENFTQTINLFASPYVNKFEAASKNLVQGDPLHLNCRAWGHPLPIVSWLKEGLPLEIDSDDRISLVDKDGVINATLIIDNLNYTDRAEYTCVATYEDESANATILVRVKDKLAALWPFLGICVEVIVLCIIIFIYEKRRTKKMEEEETPEEAGHLTNSHDHKGKDDVRQRKV